LRPVKFLKTRRYLNKKDWFVPLVKGKRVLDIGCVSHEVGNTLKPNWLHGILKQHAETILGLDKLENETEQLRKLGYNIEHGDAESFHFDKKFEIIVAGDILEHLSNPGNFLQSARASLTSNGLLLITTPNPFTLPRMIRFILLNSVGGNEEHTMWFTRKFLSQLAKRYQFRVKSISYIDDIYQWYFNINPFFHLLCLPLLAVNFIACYCRPSFSETYAYILELKK